MGYSHLRREKADAYLPQQLNIIANYFQCSQDVLRLGTIEEDMCAATDVVLPTGQTVGIRIRQPHQFVHYGDITFRHDPYPTHPTEWDKLLLGHPDYLLYAIAKDDHQLRSWWLLDPYAIRKAESTGWTCTTPPQYVRYSEDEAMMVLKLSGFMSKPKLVLASNDSLPIPFEKRCRACTRFVE